MDVAPNAPNSPPGNEPPRRPFNAGRLLGSIFAGVSLLLLGLAAFLWWQERSFLARAEHTRGLVVDLTAQYGGTGGSIHRSDHTPTYAPTFTFADREGKEHRVRSHSGTNPPSYRVGENVDVFFDPKEPDHAELRGFFSQWGAATICGGLGAVFGGSGALVACLAGTRPLRFKINGR